MAAMWRLFSLMALVMSVAGRISIKDMPTANFHFHVQLDENYTLHWDFDDTHIMFETVVKTNGYIGFGISPNGKMYPSDVVVAWVDDHGHPHLLDGYTTGHSTPTQDKNQHWHLVSANETGDTTTFRFWRDLETCDDDDVPILEGTTRVIYSYHPEDPSSTHAMDYHGPTRRGTKSLLLLDPPDNESPAKPLNSTVQNLDYLNGNFKVPATDTFYHCSTFALPDLGGKNHVIRYEPVIQAGHEKLVHHMLLYYCQGKVDPSLAGLSYNCYKERPPQLHNCYSVMVAWAIGGTAYDFPSHVGLPVGTDADPSFFILETHYDNPEVRSDFVDNSGLRLIVTSQLRQHDAGILELGQGVNDHMIIPAYTKEFLSRGYCSGECLAEALGDSEIHTFANFLHSHLLGRRLRTRHIRGDTELPPLAQDNNYDFNYQEMRNFPKEVTIKKGDRIIVECLYSSSHKNVSTFGGLSTQDEMCESFLLYYPRNPLIACMSDYMFEASTGQSDLRSYFNSWNWTSPEDHRRFGQLVNSTKVLTKCFGTRRFVNALLQQSQDELLPSNRYQRPSSCSV